MQFYTQSQGRDLESLILSLEEVLNQRELGREIRQNEDFAVIQVFLLVLKVRDLFEHQFVHEAVALVEQSLETLEVSYRTSARSELSLFFLFAAYGMVQLKVQNHADGTKFARRALKIGARLFARPELVEGLREGKVLGEVLVVFLYLEVKAVKGLARQEKREQGIVTIAQVRATNEALLTAQLVTAERLAAHAAKIDALARSLQRALVEQIDEESSVNSEAFGHEPPARTNGSGDYQGLIARAKGLLTDKDTPQNIKRQITHSLIQSVFKSYSGTEKSHHQHSPHRAHGSQETSLLLAQQEQHLALSKVRRREERVDLRLSNYLHVRKQDRRQMKHGEAPPHQARSERALKDAPIDNGRSERALKDAPIENGPSERALKDAPKGLTQQL